MCRASDKCQREKRKTINGDDLLWAMATLGFEDYIDPLKIYLSRYREVILNLTSLCACLLRKQVKWKVRKRKFGLMFVLLPILSLAPNNEMLILNHLSVSRLFGHLICDVNSSCLI